MKVPPKNVKDFLWAVDTRGKWDTFFESGKLVREIEPGKVMTQMRASKTTDWSCIL